MDREYVVSYYEFQLEHKNLVSSFTGTLREIYSLVTDCWDENFTPNNEENMTLNDVEEAIDHLWLDAPNQGYPRAYSIEPIR